MEQREAAPALADGVYADEAVCMAPSGVSVMYSITFQFEDRAKSAELHKRCNRQSVSDYCERRLE